MILFRIPRSAVRQLTGAVLFGLVVLFALAASGCGQPAEETERERIGRERIEASVNACREGGGAVRWRNTISGLWYDGCDFPPAPCSPAETEATP